MRWTFGVEPLAQTERAAPLLRRIAGHLLALEEEHPDVDRVVGELAEMEERLAALVPDDPRPRVGPAVASHGRVYVDHARDVGTYNPGFPEYTITVRGDRAAGTVTFPITFEGPPGLVHGGFLAVFFDCVIQHHNCDVGVAGKTTSLSLRYRRPALLLTEMHYELLRRQDEHRITTTGRLLEGDKVVCEVEMLAVTGDPTALPAVSPRGDVR